MGEDPSVIRAEIEQTRERVGNEVDALSYKTDVGARVGDYVDDKKESVKSKVSGAKDTVTGKVSGAKDTVTGAVPDREAIKRRGSQVRDTAESNPLGLAIGGVAVGFLVGTLLPKTRIEDERMGEASDRLVDAAKETAGEAVERGKQVAQDAAGAAVDTAKESGREQGQELSSTLQERAQDQSPSGAA